MSLIIILAGVPGSGKTTILNEVIRLFPSLHIINYGDMMLQEASSQNIEKDSLRKLPLLQQQKIGIQAAKRMTTQLPLITCIDTHAMIKTPIGYCPGLPLEVIQLLRPNVIGMIECQPSIIHERRLSDKTRNRDIESIEQIEYHQSISRSFLISCTVLSGALYVPIYNQCSPADSAQQFIHAIESYR